MENFKYKTTFSSEIKPLVSEEKDKYLAMASLVNVGDFIPDINLDDNVDLLPIAFNACVVNRVNKNGDVISTATALDICKNFINKPINIEHNRGNVVGVILTAGFSEFGTDKVLTEEEVKEKSSPFNITLGGVIWRVVNRDLSEMIEESSDPTSENYMNISASWELGFADFNLVILPEGEKNTENGEIIADEKKIEELQQYLRSFGGKGCMDDSTCVYRQVIGDVFPLGIGLTESPAADVEGIATEITVDKKEEAEKPRKIEEKEVSSEEKAPTLDELVNKKENLKNLFVKNNTETNNISQNEELNVIPKENTMKIKSVKDLTDESLKDLSASAVSDFIEEELKTASEKYAEEKAALEKTLEENKQEHEALVSNHEEVKDTLDKVKADLEVLQKEKEEKEAEEKFNEHMSSLDDDFQLTDEDREVIATDIKDMSEEEYDSYVNKMNILLKNKLKVEIEKAEAEASKEVKANDTEAEEVIESAVDEADKEVEELPNSTTPEEPTTLEKYEKAFDIDQFEIKY